MNGRVHQSSVELLEGRPQPLLIDAHGCVTITMTHIFQGTLADGQVLNVNILFHRFSSCNLNAVS